MKKHDKLNLIDNYVEIYRVIFECTQAIKNCKDIETLKNLSELCISTLNLKKLYEKTFKDINMMDDSLILLKMQLEDSLKNPIIPQNKKIFSFEFLLNKKKILEKYLKTII